MDIAKTDGYLDTSLNELKTIHSGREVIYNLLYTAFIENPRNKLYSMLNDLMGNLEALALDSEEPLLRDGVKGIGNFIALRNNMPEAEIAEFDLDSERQYTQIFCLTNSVRTAQSHYTGEDKLSRQEPYDECLKTYAEYKFPKDLSHMEDADFIAEEMRFISFMASKCAETIESDLQLYRWYIEGQLRFFKNHLLKDNWLEKFSAEVGTYSAAERMYNHLCKFMIGFVKEDAAFVELCGDCLSGFKESL